ncbi:MAG: protein phosphatase CheZ [Ignavibacteriaceae bacterium]|nr:protein phosphatase CheZ [Ignavibacteriaceae bacterium]
MTKTSNMAQLFDKLNDLKKVFVYGERLIPVIQSLVDFMRDTVPLLENINRSIADSTSKIPKAANHINDVTNATELATTEILDLVDNMNADVDRINKMLEELEKSEEQKEAMFKILNSTLNEEQKKSLNELRKVTTNKPALVKLNELISKIKSDANNITLSLQVQDITSQQLAAVNHLIQSVQGRLSSLVLDLDEADINEHKNEEEQVQSSTFDPNARYHKLTSHQEEADEIFKKNFEKASQEEIDKLFK